MWPNSLETAEILRLIDAGDATAVNALLDRHRTPLRRMVQLRLDRVLERRVDASDIVQEVLVEANRRIDDYLRNPCLPFHLWLRQIARDRIIDAHRRHRQAARRSLDREQSLGPLADDASARDLIGQLRDPELTPAAAASWQELERRFADALAELEEHDREIILMRHFEQLGNNEAAQALGLTEAAAGMRYVRAMRRLRARLSGLDPDEVVP